VECYDAHLIEAFSCFKRMEAANALPLLDRINFEESFDSLSELIKESYTAGLS